MREPIRVVVLAALLAACGDNNVHEASPDAPPDVVVRSLDTLAPAQVKAGDAIAVTCLLTEDDVPMMVPGTITVTDDASVEHSNGAIIARKVGTVHVGCSLPDLALVDDTPADVEIVAGDPAHLVTTIAPDPVTAGDPATATCEVFDSSGNLIADAAPTLAITPTDPGTTITGLDAVLTRAGQYAAICELPGATGNNAPFTVVPGLPATLLLAPLPSDAVHPVGGLITYTHVVADRYGNEIPGAAVELASTGITGAGPIVSTPPASFRYQSEGRYRVTGTVTDPTDGGVPVTAELEVLVNSTGPRIRCTGDATMIDMTPGAPLTIAGSANDVNGVASLAVNGTPVTVGAGNSFSTQIVTRFGLNFVDVTAVDDYGASTSKVCTFLVSNRWVPMNGVADDTLSLKLTQAAVDSFGDLLATIVNSQGMKDMLGDALAAADPLKPSSCDKKVWGVCVLSSEINYLGSELNGPNSVDLTLVAGGIDAHARVNNIRVDLKVHGKIAGIGYDTSGWVDITYLDVGVTLDTALVSNKPHVSVRAGTVTTQVGTIETHFSGIDGAIINVAASLAQGTLKDLVSDLISGYITNNFNAALDGIVAGLDISTLGTSFGVPKLDGSGTVTLGFGIGFTKLATTASRMLFGIGTRVTSTTANAYPTNGVALPPGVSLSDPAVSSPSTAALAAHVGLINQALHALWKANYLTTQLAGSQIVSGLPPDIQLTVDTKLPPVAYVNADGTVALQLGALEAAIRHPDLPFDLAVTLGVDAHASVTLVGNDLKFGNVVVDQIYVSTETLALTAEQQMELETLVADFAQQLANQSLNDALPVLPIPSFPLSALSAFDVPPTARLGILAPSLSAGPHHFTLRGQFGIQ